MKMKKKLKLKKEIKEILFNESMNILFIIFMLIICYVLASIY